MLTNIFRRICPDMKKIVLKSLSKEKKTNRIRSFSNLIFQKKKSLFRSFSNFIFAKKKIKLILIGFKLSFQKKKHVITNCRIEGPNSCFRGELQIGTQARGVCDPPPPVFSYHAPITYCNVPIHAGMASVN